MKIKIGLPLVMLNINLTCVLLNLCFLVHDVSHGEYSSAVWSAGLLLLCVFSSWSAIRDINSTLTDAINDNYYRG